MIIEFEINGMQYKASKLPGMTQLFVLKRIAPAGVLLMHLFGKKKVADQNKKDEALEPDNKEALEPGKPKLDPADIPAIANALSSMPDDDLHFICDRCMSLCQRQNKINGGWAYIWNSEIGEPMFDDIGMVEIAKIIGEVVKGSFGNFSPGRL